MNNLLAISSSSTNVSIAVHTQNEIKRRIYHKSAHLVCENIITGISELLDEVSLSKHDIDFIGVDNGPGSFTGIRVGIATANGLGLALNKTVKGFSSLDIIAKEIVCEHKDIENFYVAIHAGREQYYYAGYEKKENGFLKNKHDALIGEKDLVLLKDSNNIYGIISNNTDEKNIFPSANYLILLMKTENLIGNQSNFASPNYVRLSDAEINLKKEKNR